MGILKSEDGWLKFHGVRLHYLNWDNRKCQHLFLLHGFVTHARLWDHFACHFCSRYHIFALNQQGQRVKKLLPRCDPSMSQQMEHMDYQAEDLRFFLKTSQCPTLISHRSQDSFLSRADAQKVRRTVPDGRFTGARKIHVHFQSK
jgi:pimeloyl-ACP methyl ester carboxylesterase